MFLKVSEKIVLSGIRDKYIEDGKKDEIIYGLNMFFNLSINIITMVAIGIISDRLWECVLFCWIYKFMRKYSGGFHFESAWICYISSCIMYLCVIGLVSVFPFNTYATSIIVTISSVIIWGSSPVESINKPLEQCEKTVYGKKAKIRTVLVLLSYFAMLFLNPGGANVIAIGIVFVMIFMVAGEIKCIAHKNEITTTQ